MHRDKTRVQMPAKMFPHLKLCLLFMGPPLLVVTQSKKTVSYQIWWFFNNKSKILTILFTVKYEKITLFDDFLVLLRPIISRFFCMFKLQMRKKNKHKQQRVLALVLSLCFNVQHSVRLWYKPQMLDCPEINLDGTNS